MVIDFGDLKKIINEQIVNPMDHAIVLNKIAVTGLNMKNQMFNKQHLVDYQPTCENMVVDFVERIQKIFLRI